MTETFNVNTNKHKMLCTTVYLTVILICNKIRNYLEKLIHKNVEVFEVRNHQTNQFHDCLFIETRISW